MRRNANNDFPLIFMQRVTDRKTKTQVLPYNVIITIHTNMQTGFLSFTSFLSCCPRAFDNFLCTLILQPVMTRSKSKTLPCVRKHSCAYAVWTACQISKKPMKIAGGNNDQICRSLDRPSSYTICILHTWESERSSGVFSFASKPHSTVYLLEGVRVFPAGCVLRLLSKKQHAPTFADQKCGAGKAGPTG